MAMIIRFGVLAKAWLPGFGTPEPLHPEKRPVRRQSGEFHLQTFHVKNKPAPKTEAQKKANPQGPGSELTMMSMMQKFSTEEAARLYFEKIRWPSGPACPFCGSAHVYAVSANKAKKVRPGLYECAACRKQFTVTVGTVMADSHLPMNKWLLGFYMMAASKTQVSALQLQRQLEIGSYQTALHLCHRIRFALVDIMPEKFKGTVEVDETWMGGAAKGRGNVDNKIPVVSAVERKGRVHSEVVDKVTGPVIRQFLDEHVDKTAHLNTDEAHVYTKPGRQYASHDTVNHGKEEYVRLDQSSGRLATTNTAEGYFGNTKNSILGTHHAISPQHTALYMAETDFKYNQRDVTDGERAVAGMQRIEGKRMTRRQMFDRGKPSSGLQPTAKAIVPDDEMRMPAAEFDQIMRAVLTTPVDEAELRGMENAKKAITGGMILRLVGLRRKKI